MVLQDVDHYPWGYKSHWCVPPSHGVYPPFAQNKLIILGPHYLSSTWPKIVIIHSNSTGYTIFLWGPQFLEYDSDFNCQYLYLLTSLTFRPAYPSGWLTLQAKLPFRPDCPNQAKQKDTMTSQVDHSNHTIWLLSKQLLTYIHEFHL